MSSPLPTTTTATPNTPKPPLMTTTPSKNPLISNLTLPALLLAAAAFLYFCLSSDPLLFRASSTNNNMVARYPVDELEEVLRKAAMPNKTVIILVVNKAYVEPVEENSVTTMLDLFLEGLWLGDETRVLVNHLVVVTVDRTAYDRCMFKRLHCYRLVTDGVDFGSEKVYMSSDFIKMMWRRTQFLLDVLTHGYSFIFSDADIMWLRNPFTKLSLNETEDLQISTDAFNGDPRSESNPLNTGFYYIKSNNKTISLFDTWYNMKDNSTGKKEQDVLCDLMHGGLFRKLDLKVKFLPTDHFSGFCTDSKDIWSVCTVHANCCRHITAKIKDLKTVIGDWRRFRNIVQRSPEDRAVNFRWSPHIGCANSWKPSNVTKQ